MGTWVGAHGARCLVQNNPRQNKILVVEDEADVRDLLRDILEPEGYQVAMAADGQQGLRALFAERPALVITDLTMPNVDGWRFLARIREVSEVPVIILSAVDEEPAKVRGLRTGADDYLTKPFRGAELLARVAAILRRTRTSREPERDVYQDAMLYMDFQGPEVRLRGRTIELTPQEFRLLGALVRQAGSVLSPERLLDIAWGVADGGPENVRVYIGYLRRKLERDPKRPELIRSIRGFGYRYSPPRE